jgi:hypothetical protein
MTLKEKNMKIRKPIIQLISILCLVLVAVVPQAAYGDFTIMVIPDTQNDQSGTSTLTDWIVSNTSALNIKFVAHMGDVVNYCTTEESGYIAVSNALNTLGTNNIPYGVSPGNHDTSSALGGICSGTGYFPTYFGASRYTGKSYYLGSSGDYNHSFLFSADGMDFIIIFLQYNPTTTQLNWANNLLALYPNRRGIVVSHSIIDDNNNWTYQTAYTGLSGNSNLFLMLCGHMHNADGEGLRTETRTGMNPVHIVQTDYQNYSGNNKMRILTFSPANDLIYVKKIDPPGSIESQYSLTYNMTVALSGDFTGDCDVDGSDLATLIGNTAQLELSTFAGNFGKNACQ